MKSVRHIVWYKNRDDDWSSVYTNSSSKIVDKVWTKFFNLGMPDSPDLFRMAFEIREEVKIKKPDLS